MKNRRNNKLLLIAAFISLSSGQLSQQSSPATSWITGKKAGIIALAGGSAILGGWWLKSRYIDPFNNARSALKGLESLSNEEKIGHLSAYCLARVTWPGY